MLRYREAQGLTLGLPRSAGFPTGTLTGLLQTNALLQDLILNATQPGLVTAIRASGQSLMVSDQGFDLSGFSPASQVEGARSMGITLKTQQPVDVEFTMIAAGTISGGVNVEPIPGDLVQPVNAQGRALNYACGLGLVNIPAGADAALQATVRRAVVLGRMGLSADANPEDVTVRSMTVNNVELLAGQAAPTSPLGEVGLGTYGWDCTDIDGSTVGYPCRVNDQISVNLHNYNAGPITCRGGIFILPTPIPGE